MFITGTDTVMEAMMAYNNGFGCAKTDMLALEDLVTPGWAWIEVLPGGPPFDGEVLADYLDGENGYAVYERRCYYKNHEGTTTGTEDNTWVAVPIAQDKELGLNALTNEEDNFYIYKWEECVLGEDAWGLNITNIPSPKIRTKGPDDFTYINAEMARMIVAVICARYGNALTPAFEDIIKKYDPADVSNGSIQLCGLIALMASMMEREEDDIIALLEEVHVY